MLYPEFGQYKTFTDPQNPFVNGYKTQNDHVFYVEPGFYCALQGLKEKRRDDFPRIMEEIEKTVEENQRVIFTGDYDSPFLEKEGFIYREITDITDPLDIFVEDKSRGSDYGD